MIAGWEELGDLSDCHTKEQVREELFRTYPHKSKATIANWTGQLWRLRREIHDNDFVVMPLKTHPEKVAIGLIVGPYEFLHTGDRGFRHVRPTKWVQCNISRSDIRQDLLDSLGSLLTICRLERFGAARRIAHLAEYGTDPGPSPEEFPDHGVKTPRDLAERATGRDSQHPFTLSIREFLSCWHVVRRTPDVVARIEAELAELGITTRPPFTEGWIDADIAVVPVESEENGSSPLASSQSGAVAPTAWDFPPITLRVGSLESANRAVSRVRPGDPLTTAITRMVADNYSQLAVIDDQNMLQGAISWESIGMATLSHHPACVAEAIVQVRVVNYEADLLGQIDQIYDSGYVFVQDRLHTICGIVTAADLTIQFGDLARPFVLIEEAERRLRRRVDEVFSPGEIRHFVRGGRSGGTAADLTMGNYEQLLSPPEHWRRLQWNLDQDLFLTRLRQVRITRNELMHFSPDPLDRSEVESLQGFVRLLRTIDPRG